MRILRRANQQSWLLQCSGLPARTRPGAQGAQARSGGAGTQKLRRTGGSGTRRVAKGAKTSTGGQRDSNTVFVAGATGRLGLRIVRQLLLAGFRVRAGARNTARAREYADLATAFELLPDAAAKRLEIVSVDLEDPDTIAAAIGNAGKVVQAIGAAEDNVLDFGAPKRIDGDAAISLVQAATQAGVQQYVMVTSLGTGKFGWPAGALNLFGGILVQKRRAEKALEDSGLPYAIVRPGGMERPTDDFKLTHNVRLAARDSLFGGQVSRLQVAELIAAALADPQLAENKVLEVVAEPEAPKTSYADLLGGARSEVVQADRLARLQRLQEAETRVASLEEEVEDARLAAEEARQIVSGLQEDLDGKRAAARSTEQDVAPALQEAQESEAQVSSLRLELEDATAKVEAAKAVLSAYRSAQKEGRSLSGKQIEAIEAKASSEGNEAGATQPRGPRNARKGGLSGFSRQQQEGLAEGIAQKEINMKLGKDGPQPSAAEKGVAEGIAQKEIALKLGKDGPQPSAAEKGLAEGIAQKEIAIGSGRDEPIRQAGGAGTAPSGSAARPDGRKQQAPPQRRSPADPAAESRAAKLRDARSKAAGARSKRETDFLSRLESERKEAAGQKSAAARKRSEEAIRASAEKRAAMLAKQEESRRAEAERSVKSRRAQEAAATSQKTASSNGQEALQASKQNAAEARQWIDSWRTSQAGNGSAPAAEAKTSTSSGQPSGSAGAGANGADAVNSANAQEARQWIEDWRARTMAAKKTS